MRITDKQISRREALAGAGALALASDTLPASAAPDQGLRDIAKARGLLYGCAVNAGEATFADARLMSAISRECSILVPENQLKWGSLERVRGKLNFAEADRLASFGVANDAKLRGHTLIWHQQVPNWVEAALSEGKFEDVVKKHVREVVGHYKGRVHSWDVVNEAIDPSAGRPDGLRQTPFLRALGPQYLDIAFQAAHESDPDALLVYNEFGLEQTVPNADRKRAAVLRMLAGMKARGVPVQALGIQAHLRIGRPFNEKGFAGFIGDVAEMGLKILVTELDVNDQDYQSGDIAARDKACADLVGTFLNVILSRNDCVAVLTWGLADMTSWLNRPNTERRKDGLAKRPLPLDDQLNRKPMWQAMAKAFDAAPKR